MATNYGNWCPLCGKPAVQDGKCLACGYEIGSDADIDNDPVPHGGYSDERLVEAQRNRKRGWIGILPGLGLLMVVVGLLISLNGGGNTVGIIGLVILVVSLFIYFRMVMRMNARAWYNRQKYWAYGDEPDWRKNQKR